MSVSANRAAPEPAWSNEVNVFAYLETLWQYRHLIFGLVILAVAATAAVSLWVIPPTYEAVSLLRVGQGGLAIGAPDTYKEILLSPSVLERVAVAAGKREQDFKRAVSVRAFTSSSVLKLAVQADSPGEAEHLGDIWYQAFLEKMRELWDEVLARRIASEKANVKDIEDKSASRLAEKSKVLSEPAVSKEMQDSLVEALQQIQLLETWRSRIRQDQLDDILIISPFRAEKDPVAPIILLNCFVAGFIALMLGIFLSLGIEGWRSYKSVL